jgi:hypothetical protein
MSEKTEVTAKLSKALSLAMNDTVGERVDDILKMVLEIDEDYVALVARINTEFARLNDEAVANQNRLHNEIKNTISEIHETLADLREQFVEKVRERIQAVSSDEIAESLTKKVLTTRPATREEIKTGGNVVAVRQVTAAEIRKQN